MENKVNVHVKKLNEDAFIPEYATEGSVGFDLISTGDYYLEPGKTVLIATGLSVAIPAGYEIQVRPRSGASARTMLRVANAPGTIDSDYRGEIKVILTNTGITPELISKGDKVAQGVLCRVPKAEFVQVEELDVTARGEGGFGSTGKNTNK